jgi:hypothetical protein
MMLYMVRIVDAAGSESQDYAKVSTGGKAAPCRIFVCGYAFLQIVARLRHAVFCQNQWFRPHFFQAFRSESIGRK